jgi:iron complex transport system substrate-binding protein
MTRTIELPERGTTLPPLPEIDDATRREFLIGAAGLLLLPAGCGGGESGGAASDEMRTIDSDLGTVEVPSVAARVVSFDAILTDSLVAIGAPVAASLPTFGRRTLGWPFTPEEAEDITVLSATGDYLPQLEEVAEFGPDLIVSLSWAVEYTEDETSRIAPVFALDDTFTWRENTLRLSEAVFGSTERGERALAPLDGEVHRLAPRLPDVVVSLLRVHGDGTLLTYHRPSGPGTLLDALGLEMSSFPEGAEDANGDGSVAQLSGELLTAIDGDVLFVMVDDPEQGFPKALTSSPLWERVSAVANEQTHLVSTAGWATNGPLGWQRGLLEDVRRILT